MLTENLFEGLKKINLSTDPQKSMDRISADFKAASADVKKKILELSGLTRSTFYNAFQKGSASPKMVLALAQLLGVSPYYYTGENNEKGVFNDDVLKRFLEEKNLSVTAKKKTAPKAKAVKAEKPVKSVKTAKKPSRKPAAKAKAVTKTAPKASTKVAPKAATKPAVKKPGRKPAAKAVTKTAPKATNKTAAKSAPMPKANDEVFIQVSIPKSLKLQRAVTNLDEESAVLLLRALIRKADASENAKALCDIIKSCLLS